MSLALGLGDTFAVDDGDLQTGFVRRRDVYVESKIDDRIFVFF